MNLKRLVLLMATGLFLLSMPALAQNKLITGKITDEKGAAVVGASVLVKGTTLGTQTGADGSFKISVPPTATTLVVSSVNYGSKQVAISGGTINISLQSTAAALADVVVIGYGTAKRKDLTGSVASVSSKDFQQGEITTPEQLILGKVSGVTITSNGGSPGSGSVIRIRGGASLNASNDPLIVIDGVPLASGPNGGTGSISGAANALSLINPNDIETFTVLKDAAATAIYGSRASNGVILITTKHGRGKKPTINFSTVFSVGTLPKEYPVLSASEFRNYVDTYGDSTQKSLLGDANTDWQKQIFHNALTTDDNLSISGVWGKMPYRINGEYLNQDGILQTDNLQRTSVSLNISPHLLNNSLKIDINVHGAITNTRFANQGAIQSAITFDPTQPVYSPGNKFGGYWEWLTSDSTRNVLSNLNPVGLLQEQVNKSQVERSFGNIQFDYAVPALKGLHANLNLGYDAASGSGTVNIPAYAAQSYNNSSNLTYIAPADSGNLYSGTNNYYQQKYFNKLGEFYLSYNKDLPSIKSNINAVAGTGYYDNSTQNYNYASFGATKDTIPGTQPEYALAPTEYTMESYYARLIYTFDNKYVLSGSYRTDGSSRFGPSYRWGQFPGGAFTWKINQEDFLKNSTVLSTLNMRLSYGETGNQDGIGLYNYIPTYFLSQPGSLYPFGGNYYNLYTPNAYVANLKWETTDTYDGGFDYGFLKNRINGSMDYYYKKTFNLLANVSIPAGTNYANQVTTNVGSMNDQGVEFNINIIPIQSKDIDWEVGFNAAYNHFKITNLTLYPNPKFLGDLTGGISGGTGNTVQVDAVGYAPNEFYLYQQVYGPNGKPIEGLYVDQNRDGIINSNDLVKEESPYPSWTFGFSNNLTYKKWTLNFTMHSNVGQYVYNNVASNLAVTRSILNPGGFLENAPSSALTTGFVNNQYFSDYYLENASFLRMDNIGISYNYKLSRASNGHNLRISLNCQNVFVITKYTGTDPEIYGGIDNNFYPRPRTFSLGLNLTL